MRSRIPWLLLAVTSTAIAAPAPTGHPVRKPAPPEVSSEVVKEFVRGIVADKAGDLDTAARRYADANQKSPQANTYYNLADVERRMEKFPKAIESYKKYLELAPNAPDRKDVEALIDQLANSDFVAVIDGEEIGGIIFVDGKLLGPSPQVVRLPAGRHATDRVSPTGHRNRTFEAKPGHTEHITLQDWKPSSKPEPVGNVVLTSSAFFTTQGSWDDQGIRFEFPGRNTLAPGHYETFLFDKKRTCTPLVFDVPKGNVVTYVYVDAKERVPGDYKCQVITVHQQTVKVVP